MPTSGGASQSDRNNGGFHARHGHLKAPKGNKKPGPFPIAPEGTSPTDCASGFAHAPAPDRLVTHQTPKTRCQTPPKLPRNRDNADAAAVADAIATTATTKARTPTPPTVRKALRAQKAPKAKSRAAETNKVEATNPVVAVPATVAPAASRSNSTGGRSCW